MLKPSTKTSDLVPTDVLKGYYWKRKDYDNLWRYHDYEYQELVGHPYGIEFPDIIEIEDTQEDRERYYQILFNILNLDVHKRKKYDVVSTLVRKRGTIPDLGIDVIELTDYYHCGDLTEGLFIYHVQYDSVSYWAGFQDGDVITMIRRPEVEKRPYKNWKKDVYNVYRDDDGELKVQDINSDYKYYFIRNTQDMLNVFNLLREDERVIFTIYRDGEKMEISMNVPFKPYVYMRIVVPKIVIKTIPDYYMRDGELIMRYTEIRNITNQVASENMNELFKRVSVEIDNDGNLTVESPDTLTDVNFKIDNDGNLVIEYE